MPTASANLTINGSARFDNLGWSVGSGNFNGDAFDDIIVGATGADPANGGSNAGKTYIFFGSDLNGYGEANSIDANSSANLTINGSIGNDALGSSVGSGNFSGDAFDDIIVGAKDADTANGGSNAGKTYIFFGSDLNGYGEANSIDANSKADFVVNGSSKSDALGESVASGNFSGDAFDDLIVSAFLADPANGGNDAGKTYIFHLSLVTSAVDVYSSVQLNISLNSEDADYLTFLLTSPDGHFANLTDLWPNIGGRIGSTTADDVVRKGTGEEYNLTQSPENGWNDTVVGSDNTTYYIALYDNTTEKDDTKNITIALVNAVNNSIRLLNLSHYNDSENEAGVIRLHYNTSDADTTSSLKYYLVFTMCQLGGNCIANNMSHIANEGLEPLFFGDFAGEEAEAAPDTTPPLNSIINPSQSQNWNVSGNFLINATINDSESNVDFVNLTIFNITSNVTAIIPMTLGSGAITSGNWNATFDSTILTDGFYNLSVNATDAAGITNISENRSITIDNTAANVSAVTPANGTSFADQLFLINASVNDTLTKVFNATFRLMSAPSTETAWFYAELNSGSIDQGYWNTSVDSTTLTNADYNITINATDFAGNQIIVNISEITINNAISDSTAPNNTIITPAANANISGSFLINSTINDSESAVPFVNLTILNISGNVTAPIIMTNATGNLSDAGYWNVTFNSATLADGFYNLSVNATDAAGNTNISRNVSITIDNTLANATMITPANATTQTGNMLINASVNDTTSKVFNVTFRLINPSRETS